MSSMNGLFYATSKQRTGPEHHARHINSPCTDSFLPALIFPQTTAPRYKNGFPSVLAFSLISAVLVCESPEKLID